MIPDVTRLALRRVRRDGRPGDRRVRSNTQTDTPWDWYRTAEKRPGVVVPEGSMGRQSYGSPMERQVLEETMVVVNPTDHPKC